MCCWRRCIAYIVHTTATCKYLLTTAPNNDTIMYQQMREGLPQGCHGEPFKVIKKSIIVYFTIASQPGNFWENVIKL